MRTRSITALSRGARATGPVRRLGRLAGAVALASLWLAPLAAAPGPLAGCAPPPPAAAPSEPLPPYEGAMLDVFDDAIDPHAVGLELEARLPPRSDPMVTARAKQSDVVLRARVLTVSGSAGSGARTYELDLKSVERIAGKHPVGDEFSLQIGASSPSLGIVKSMEGQLVGKTLVVYVKAFARADGQRVLHFHASADEPDVVAAVKNVVLLDELK